MQKIREHMHPEKRATRNIFIALKQASIHLHLVSEFSKVHHHHLLAFVLQQILKDTASC